MTARTHDLAAFVALSAAFIAYPPAGLTTGTLIAALLANQLGGIAPDIDQPTAPLWRNLPTGHVAGKLFSRMLGGHRFLSHSLIGYVLFGYLSFLLLHWLQPVLHHIDVQLVWTAFLIGYGSHLVMDSFTKEGVPWLLPIPVKFGLPPLRRLRITTGKAGEYLLVFPVLCILLLFLYVSNYPAVSAYLQSRLGR